jgi:hypothetical protein
MTEIDTIVEAWTDRLYDACFRNKNFYEICSECGNVFDYNYDEASMTKYNKKLLFCCEGCRDDWEKENSWDYID